MKNTKLLCSSVFAGTMLPLILRKKLSETVERGYGHRNANYFNKPCRYTGIIQKQKEFYDEVLLTQKEQQKTKKSKN